MEKLTRIQERYATGAAETIGKQLLARLVQYLDTAYEGPAGKPYSSEALEALADGYLSSSSQTPAQADQIAALMEAYCQQARVLHSPRYMGHQVPPPLPLGGLMQGITLAMNQGLAIEEMGPFAGAVERALIKRLLEKVGFDREAGHGIVTSGGTLANMTALLAARAQLQPDAWKQGHRGSLKIFVSGNAHYCMARAMGVMGLGDQNCIRVPGRLGRDNLEAALQAVAPGDVLAVVASAPSTPAGQIDDLEAVADVCADRGIWLHVDAVHGASLLFSGRYADRLRGLERADSVSWDAHKMLHVPSLATFLLYKNKQHALGAFQQNASYLFREEGEPWRVDPAYCTFECTKPSLLTGLWAVWSVYGEQAFADNVERCMELTEQAYELFKRRPGFEAGPEPETNILCFRWLPEAHLPLAQANSMQMHLREQIVQQANFYITTSELDGVRYLRLTLINPLTEVRHLEELCEAIEDVARRL